MKRFFVCFAFFMICSLFIGCGEKTEKPTKSQQNKKVDVVNGLQWSNKFKRIMTYKNAVNYCQNLNEDGFNDWNLPNIDELRTLVQNCPKTETDGECKVSEKNKCLSSKCFERELDKCHCESRENNGGYYSKLGDDDNVELWSSSPASDDITQWTLDFHSAVIYYLDPFYPESRKHVRCVRKIK